MWNGRMNNSFPKPSGRLMNGCSDFCLLQPISPRSGVSGFEFSERAGAMSQIPAATTRPAPAPSMSVRRATRSQSQKTPENHNALQRDEQISALTGKKACRLPMTV